MVVDSRDAAIAATSARIPDVILLTALLSPRDEHELIAHLRGLAGAEHVQTHTIPQLASSGQDSDTGQEQGGGLFGKLRRKKNADAIPGCDPAAFADEVGTFIARAAEMKAHAAFAPPPVIEPRRRDEARTQAEPGAAPHGSAPAQEEPVVDAGSAWASPFEWRRPDPAAQKKKDAAPRTPLVTNAPLAVVAEEEEARRAEADRRAREEAERAREHVEAEAAARRERARLEAEAAAHRERERLEAAEAAAKRERERLEAEQRAKQEAEHRAKEETERHAKAEAERRAKEEAERRAKAEAERRAKEEAERRAKAEAERRAKEEAERRAKAEAERRAKEEAERRAKAEAERRAKEEAERRAKAEAERRAKEEAAKRELERLEAERRAKEEVDRRAREEAERLAKEEEARLERERLEAERLEADRLAKEAERLEAEGAEQEIEIDLDHDPFADFRGEEPESALLKLMPVTAWARTDERRAASPLESPRNDEFHELMAGLSIPTHVASVAYARGCRIRRVRVPAPRPAPRARLSRPLILSKRALHAAKNDQQSGA
jgi:hypothetical protein